MPRVHLLCGLNGAGKTTHARHLEAGLPAVRFSLDEWMLRLHEMRFDHPQYAALAGKCTDQIWDLALQVLAAGVDVVVDWNQWSRARRRTWCARADSAGRLVVLHYVRVPLDEAVGPTRAVLRVP